MEGAVHELQAASQDTIGARDRTKACKTSAVLSVPTRNAPDQRVSFGARELPLQRREWLDELVGLERTVSALDRPIRSDAVVVVGTGAGPQRAKEQVSRRPAAQSPKATRAKSHGAPAAAPRSDRRPRIRAPSLRVPRESSDVVGLSWRNGDTVEVSLSLAD